MSLFAIDTLSLLSITLKILSLLSITINTRSLLSITIDTLLPLVFLAFVFEVQSGDSLLSFHYLLFLYLSLSLLALSLLALSLLALSLLALSLLVLSLLALSLLALSLLALSLLALSLSSLRNSRYISLLFISPFQSLLLLLFIYYIFSLIVLTILFPPTPGLIPVSVAPPNIDDGKRSIPLFSQLVSKSNCKVILSHNALKKVRVFMDLKGSKGKRKHQQHEEGYLSLSSSSSLKLSTGSAISLKPTNRLKMSGGIDGDMFIRSPTPLSPSTSPRSANSPTSPRGSNTRSPSGTGKGNFYPHPASHQTRFLQGARDHVHARIYMYLIDIIAMNGY